MQIKKEACRTHNIVFSVDLEFTIHLWKRYTIGQCNIKTYCRLWILNVCLRFFWDIQKSGLKTELELERHERKKLKFGLEERKSLNYVWKNRNLCEILSGMCPPFLQLAWINFHCWYVKKTQLRLGKVGFLRLIWVTNICSVGKVIGHVFICCCSATVFW